MNAADHFFGCVYDNNPIHHRTVASVEGAFINCSVTCQVGAEPMIEPSLYDMLGFKIHCFRIHAAAKPRPFSSALNIHVDRLAQKI